MNTDLTDAMVSDMDETSDWMHSIPAPFPTVEMTIGIPVQRAPTPYRTKGLVKAYSRGITVTGAAQGQRDNDKRDALRRGGR